ncbi:GGDEF domain-containing protein [Desulforamulus hydrothermalis]|uniref:Putative Diguanylate cyclase n=1 Tax=Desulforamulus hydrothermalis Lam5 = DSM 18033 TaxID=1121428 RepID=K8DZ55_9FIRM|nr:sensor domain-containing diguanylate cyclase [Desulforamulus hydrothermalis]CCO08185.1 putative Diguanylate cyclase [Desulforamulus hydrothermalis Lam5 = DSM 18033]SHH22957.1 diguanylate cyclase (GGDEF) domain-containing protein [Desulforamulus hydrothermalis Lam5 = DSM 18033]
MLSRHNFNLQDINQLEVELFIGRLRKVLVGSGLLIWTLLVQFNAISPGQGTAVALAVIYCFWIEKYYRNYGVKGWQYLSSSLDFVLIWGILSLMVNFQPHFLGLFLVNAVLLAMRFGLAGWPWLVANGLLFSGAVYFGGHWDSYSWQIIWLLLVSVLSTRLAQQHRQMDRRLLALHRLSHHFNAALRVSEVIQKALQELKSIWPNNHISIAELNCQGDFIILGSTRNELPGKLELGTAVTTQLVQQQEMAVIKNTLLDKRLANDFLKKFYLRSVLLVPVVVQGETTGLVILEAPALQDFNHDEMAIIMLAATQIGISLKNAGLYERMENLARLDELTKVYNRRALYDVASQEFILAHYKNSRLALVMLDLDHFKKINDEFGHPAGDQVLVRVASVMKAHLRQGDSVARYGGEEFVLVLPGASRQVALEVAERIRAAVANLNWQDGWQVTVSAGVAAYPEDGRDLPELLKKADLALYRAKARGRNRVQAYGGNENIINLDTSKTSAG